MLQMKHKTNSWLHCLGSLLSGILPFSDPISLPVSLMFPGRLLLSYTTLTVPSSHRAFAYTSRKEATSYLLQMVYLKSLLQEAGPYLPAWVSAWSPFFSVPLLA